MTWEKSKLSINNTYLVDAKYVLQYRNINKLHTFLTKRIKSDYLKEVILSVELNLLAIKPYSYE